MTDENRLLTLARLAATIKARADADPDVSYTARLLADPALAARKFGEEAVETLVAALDGDKTSLTAEAADVIYHLMALLAARDVTLDDVLTELARRENRSGLDEKASRGPKP